ncbi:MAG: hypothetical protein IPL55_13340 [Saprospiraceae bacterium]|nr:hypothetical protein [Saprospiraceae bacterium]
MHITFSSFLSKIYWPLVGLYIIYLLVFIMLYFTQINDWSDRWYYNMMNLKKIGIPFAILCGSIYLKYNGNEKAGHYLLFIPAGGAILLLLLGFLMILIMAQFFGK